MADEWAAAKSSQARPDPALRSDSSFAFNSLCGRRPASQTSLRVFYFGLEWLASRILGRDDG